MAENVHLGKEPIGFPCPQYFQMSKRRMSAGIRRKVQNIELRSVSDIEFRTTDPETEAAGRRFIASAILMSFIGRINGI